MAENQGIKIIKKEGKRIKKIKIPSEAEGQIPFDELDKIILTSVTRTWDPVQFYECSP
jgi:hypothetical protein